MSQTTNTIKLSATVTTKNEEAKIGDCLDSLAFCDEIIVVDSGSTDRTREIAKEKGARVIERAWVSYAEQKNFANGQTRGEWILCLDADERISKTLRNEIKAVINDPVADVYAMPRRVYYMNRWVDHSGWYPDRKQRLFRKERGRWSEEKVHERLLYTGKAKNLSGDIYHLSFTNISAHYETINNFTDLAAIEQQGEKVRFGWFPILFRPPATFIKMYFLKLGFLDGVAGFIISALSSYHVICKYVKIAEVDKP